MNNTLLWGIYQNGFKGGGLVMRFFVAEVLEITFAKLPPTATKSMLCKEIILVCA